MADTFSGFDAKTTGFLRRLGKNNERDWFKANQDDFEGHVREPTFAFIRAMAPLLAKLSPRLQAVDKKVGGSMMRIQRDTRFSKDKRPYNENISLRFLHEKASKDAAPGFYLRFTAKDLTLGVGVWRPEPPALKRIRDAVAADPAGWKKAVGAKAFRDAWTMEGESLKRPPKGYDPEHPCVEDLMRKDFAAFRAFPKDALFGRDLPKRVAAAYKQATPMLAFVCTALRTPL